MSKYSIVSYINHKFDTDKVFGEKYQKQTKYKIKKFTYKSYYL